MEWLDVRFRSEVEVGIRPVSATGSISDMVSIGRYGRSTEPASAGYNPTGMRR